MASTRLQEHHSAQEVERQESYDYLRPVFNIRRDTVAVRTPLGKQIHRLRVPNTMYYLHPQRDQLYILQDAKPDEADSRKTDPYFIPINLWGAPKLEALVRFSEEDAPAGQQVYYRLAVRDQVKLVAHEDLVAGRCWEHWPETAISSKKMVADYHAVVAQQLNMFEDIPQHRGMRATGWIVRTDGRHALALPDGGLWGAGGRYDDAQAHLVLSAKHTKPYPEDLRVDGSSKGQNKALRFLAGISKGSIASLSLLTAIRSIMYGVLPSDFSTMLRASSGRGKTGLTSYIRNLTGEFLGWPPPDATASFTSTAARVEYEAAQIKSLPVTIDDLVIHAGMSDREKQDKGKALDAILRSVGNNTAVRGRMTAKMGAQLDHKIDACPLVTGEHLLPDLAQSALNRSIILEIPEEGIDKKALAKYGDGCAPGLRGVGYGLISHLASQWDAQGVQLADEWRTYLAAQRGRLESAILAQRSGEPIPDEASRLPSNGANLLLAAHLLEQYCAAHGIDCPITAEGIFADLVRHLCLQIVTICDLIGGGDGVPLSTKVLEALRAALADHLAFVVRPDGSLPHYEDMPTGYLIDESGAQRLADAYCAPARATCIGAIDKEKGYVMLYGNHAYRILQRILGKTTCPSADHCWGSLDRKGFLFRESQRQRTRKASCTLPGIEEVRPRMLFIPLAVFFPERLLPAEFEPLAFRDDAESATSTTLPQETDVGRSATETVVAATASPSAAPPSAFVISAMSRELLSIFENEPPAGLGWAEEATRHYVRQGMPPLTIILPSEMAGVDDVRGKPFAGKDLYQALKKLIRADHAAAVYATMRAMRPPPNASGE